MIARIPIMGSCVIKDTLRVCIERRLHSWAEASSIGSVLAVANDSLNCGESGERCARQFLEQQGYVIAACNYRTTLGEIDIIAWDKDTLCFVEVKTRRGQ